ncbi:hypothetical protein C1H46_008901 [Malus baccata]|uniref:Uncharacterized protein n=1 Tax=Malus baccata TaxID=106549 RepID=A0A540N345_MALBA|nr:hypothetical protein C1H46_008901 [Malus baccata]
MEGRSDAAIETRGWCFGDLEQMEEKILIHPTLSNDTRDVQSLYEEWQNETRERLDGVEAFDGGEGLEPEVATVTGEPDPEREPVRSFYGIHFWAPGLKHFRGSKTLRTPVGHQDGSRWPTPAQKQYICNQGTK